jgi:hypothetical protein
MPLRTAQLKSIEERKDPFIQIPWFGDFVVEDSVATASHRSDAENRAKKLRSFRSDLRHVERQRDTPRQSAITLSPDWDVEASLSVDESGNPVTQVARDPIQPG